MSHARNRNVFRLEAGHVFTIEPMLTEGSPELYVAGDGWTVLTRDEQRAAHPFAHAKYSGGIPHQAPCAAPHTQVAALASRAYV